MKGLRTDLILITLLVSAAIHVGVMFYMRPMVMTHVTGDIRRASRRGPMKVVRAQERPEPVRIDTVSDVLPEKDAPQAEETVSVLPRTESLVPSGEETAIVLPPIALPVLSEREVLPDVLPELRTSELSPLTIPEPKMVTSEAAVRPSEMLAALPSASDEQTLLPRLDVAVPDLTDVLDTPLKETSAEDLASDDKAKAPAFEPSAEVQEKVDAQFVEAEKDAVRGLVDVANARDLSEAVEIGLTCAEEEASTYFRVTVSPKAQLRPVPKDVVVLIDASGSIGKDRMGSIRGAARRILRSAANTGDRFNLVAFRDRYSYAFRTWQKCTESSFAAADRWLGNVAPFGRTDVFATIASVLTLPRDPARPLIALVVTDGEANAGVSDTADILSKFTALNDGLVSVYMYGVKASANRELIDVLTRGNRGESFIFSETGWTSRARAGEGIEPLSRRFRDPVLSDLRVVFASDCAATAYPRVLRNLYLGGSVELVGRVPKGTKEIAFSLKGLNGRDAYEAFFRLPLSGAEAEPALPEAWRTEREIARLLQ